MTERGVDAVAVLEAEARQIAARISANRQSVLSTLDSSLHDEDLRSTSLQRLSAVLLNYVVGLVVLRRHLLHFDWWESNWSSGLTDDHKMAHATTVYSNLSFGTFLSAFSILEAMVRQILFAFDSDAEDESTAGYWNVRTYLFQNHLDLEHSHYASLFQLISTLRNCVHNQGVYRDIKRKKLIVEHNGIRYTFLHMVPPNCLQPETLIALLAEMGSVMFDILSDPNVVALESVEDGYEKLGSHETAEPI